MLALWVQLCRNLAASVLILQTVLFVYLFVPHGIFRPLCTRKDFLEYKDRSDKAFDKRTCRHSQRTGAR